MNCNLLEHIEEIKRLALGSDETIVLKTTHLLSLDAQARTVEMAQRIFGTDRVVVLDPSIEIEIVATDALKR